MPRTANPEHTLVIAAIPTGIGNAVTSGVIAVCLLLLGKGADWLVKRRAERKAGELVADADARADEQADLARLKQMADEAYRWGEMQRTRADEIAAEREMFVKGQNARIETLSREMGQLRTAIVEKDTLIAEQAGKIARLERRVKHLEDEARAPHKEPLS